MVNFYTLDALFYIKYTLYMKEYFDVNLAKTSNVKVVQNLILVCNKMMSLSLLDQSNAKFLACI